jgi:serine/threonine-protein kinase RsbW
MNTAKVSLQLASSLESVEKAAQTAGELAEQCGFNEQIRFGIDLAIREAMVNAIRHGNQFDAAKQVTLSLETTPERLTIKIRDEGKGLDPATVPDPLAQENLCKGSGRGLLLMRTFMDRVEVAKLSPGTEITLTKFLRPAAGGGQ